MPIPIRILAVLSLLLACTLTACANPAAPFQINPEKPFHLKFGRGSGMDGLSVVILDESGRAVLSREGQKFQGGEIYAVWSTTELTLPHNLVREIASAINSENLTTLNRSYSDHFVDGTQWVLLITQGTNSKAVYFDNNFPSPIKNFATTLDDILNRGGLDKATWQPGGRQLDKPLWKSIEPTK